MEEHDALDDAEKAAFILQGEFLADREENGLIVLCTAPVFLRGTVL